MCNSDPDYINKLIESYTEDFKTKTNLTLYIHIKAKEAKATYKLPMERIFLSVNKFIPQKVFLKSPGATIKTRFRMFELVFLRIVFNEICKETGYSNNDIAHFLEINHSTTVHYSKKFKNYLKMPKADPGIVNLYHTVQNSIQNERIVSQNIQQQIKSESGILAIFDEDRSTPAKHQHQHGAEVVGAGMGNYKHYGPHTEKYRIFERDTVI